MGTDATVSSPIKNLLSIISPSGKNQSTFNSYLESNPSGAGNGQESSLRQSPYNSRSRSKPYFLHNPLGN